jgi:hypothetical protein
VVPYVVLVLIVGVLGLIANGAQADPIAGDVSGDGVVSAPDVQLVINAALGIDTGFQDSDIDKSGVTDAADVQLVINAVLGISIDTDNDGLSDGAEANVGTDPNRFDTDGDGVYDGQELATDGDPLTAAEYIIISEFAASNDTGLADEDGEFEDWIELHNRGDRTVHLNGWALTDDPADLEKWVIPDISIESGRYLVIFASGKDRGLVKGSQSAEFHCNFKLETKGEFLGLVNGAGALQSASTFDPAYAEQITDYSYGVYGDEQGFWYFEEPTPGRRNREFRAFRDFAGSPIFSRPSGTFVDPFQLTLSASAPDAVIRYTTDGDAPDASSTLYSGPITIDTTTQIRAWATGPGMLPGPVATAVYLGLESDVAGFSSNLPIVIVDTFDESIPGSGSTDMAFAGSVFIEIADESQRASIRDSAEYAGRSGIRIRGNSSAYFDKHQYKFETWGEDDNDLDASLLGLPTESDWVLFGPYSDKTLMRNHMMYSWSRTIGRYAARTRYIEMFLNTGGERISYDEHYVGVFMLMEKIKRGPDRVDVADLRPEHDSEPEITGGYILKKDWSAPGFETDIYNEFLIYEGPESDELTDRQKDWLRDHFHEMEEALSSPTFDDMNNGYRAYLDVGSFIDHHILVEMARNVDGFVLSTFLYKDRGGKIHMGPIWDYNGSLGGADYFRAWEIEGWHYEWEGFPADNDNNYNWYYRIFEDDEFLLDYADRWFELRRSHFVTSEMHQDINETAAHLSEAQARNFERWDILDRYVWPNYVVLGNYPDEVDWLKSWLADRLEWMDLAIAEEYGDTPPVIQVGGQVQVGDGTFQPGQSLALALPLGSSGTIYYTLDGSDPRARPAASGLSPSISPTALVYRGTVTLADTVHVRARVLGDSWGALNESVLTPASVVDGLRITEIMYHPPENPAGNPLAEYIELTNVGDADLNLNLVRFTNGIDFTFPSRVLTPGEHIVVIKDREAFEEEYGDTVATAGVFAGSLDNGGERIQLETAAGEVIHDFRFDDVWYPTTDGAGYSLTVIDEASADATAWNTPEGWRASTASGGSPGEADAS